MRARGPSRRATFSGVRPAAARMPSATVIEREAPGRMTVLWVIVAFLPNVPYCPDNSSTTGPGLLSTDRAKLPGGACQTALQPVEDPRRQGLVVAVEMMPAGGLDQLGAVVA